MLPSSSWNTFTVSSDTVRTVPSSVQRRYQSPEAAWSPRVKVSVSPSAVTDRLVLASSSP